MGINELRKSKIYRGIERSHRDNICFVCNRKVKPLIKIGKFDFSTSSTVIDRVDNYLPIKFVRDVNGVGLHLWAGVIIHKKCVKER